MGPQSRGSESKQEAVGPSRVKKLLCVPHCLSIGKGFSLLDLPLVPKNRPKQLLIREVRGCRLIGGAGKKQEFSDKTES